MKWKPSPALAGLLTLLLLIPLLSSCFLVGFIEDLFDPEKDEPLPVPTEVAELAGGIFDLVGLVFEAENSDPTLDTYPDGMTLAWVTQDQVLRITLADFAPPDDPLVRANGSITLTQMSSSPWTIGIAGTVSLANHTFASVALSGTAVWAAGVEPGDAEPQSITGTFTVDGVSYSLDDVVAAIDDGDDGGDDGGDVTVTPLPSTFLTSAGDYSQLFDDRVWRPGPAASPDAPWADYNYLTFEISPDGAQYTLYQGGVNSQNGWINWLFEGGEQKIDFLQAEKQSCGWKFTVLDFSPCHLHLRMLWGSEVKEWIFGAGIDCLAGIVVDAATIMMPPYSYNMPLAGAKVELCVSDQFYALTPSGLEAYSDARGYFEFADVSGVALSTGESLRYRVTRASYLDTESPMNSYGWPYVSGAQGFATILMTASE